MNGQTLFRQIAAALAATVLCGCSTLTPNFSELGQKPTDRWVSEQQLIDHIQCQLAAAVHSVVEVDEANAGNIPAENRATWIRNWGANISLVLSVNNKDNFSPGLTFSNPLQNVVTVFPKNGNVPASRNWGLGFGATLAADATRTETIGFFYSFQELLDSPIDPGKCQISQGRLLSSDLKIGDFLTRGVNISYHPGVILRKSGESPYQTFTYEVKFIVTKSANVNPSFKLVEISADQSGNLYSTSRIRTDDLTITMGKVEKTGQKAAPSPELQQQHLANLIGQAVANALQGRPQQ